MTVKFQNKPIFLNFQHLEAFKRMSVASEKRSPNVLIVENANGEVYIVENKESISQVERILRESAVKPKKISRTSRIHIKEELSSLREDVVYK